MKQLILAIALAAALGSAHAEQNAPSLSKVNGSLTAEAGKAYGDLDTVNGSITIRSGSAAAIIAAAPGRISSRTPPSRVAASTAPSVTCRLAPSPLTVMTQVVPFTTAAR